MEWQNGVLSQYSGWSCTSERGRTGPANIKSWFQAHEKLYVLLTSENKVIFVNLSPYFSYESIYNMCLILGYAVTLEFISNECSKCKFKVSMNNLISPRINTLLCSKKKPPPNFKKRVTFPLYKP